MFNIKIQSSNRICMTETDREHVRSRLKSRHLLINPQKIRKQDSNHQFKIYQWMFICHHLNRACIVLCLFIICTISFACCTALWEIFVLTDGYQDPGTSLWTRKRKMREGNNLPGVGHFGSNVHTRAGAKSGQLLYMFMQSLVKITACLKCQTPISPW